MGFLEEDHRGSKMSSLSHHMKSVFYKHDLSLLKLTSFIWLRYCLPSFSTLKLLFLSAFKPVPFGRKSLYATHT